MEFTNKRLKILELFGGIGACSKALERIGIDFEIVDYVEIDKYAVKSFNAIHNTNFEPQDITQWDKDIDVDLVMHGSPCQDFSVAGKQAGGDKGSGTRSSLMYETVRIVEKLKPKYVIWENVKNLLSKKHKHNFDAYIETMNILGYNSYYQVLNAKYYGIPQNRERVYTISIRKDIDNNNFTFPEKEELKLRLKDMLEDEVDEKYYLSKKMVDFFTYNEQKQIERGNGFRFNVTDGNVIAKAVTTRAGGRMDDNFIGNKIYIKKDKKINKSLQETLEKNEIPDGINMIDSYNRNVRNDEISGTITTRVDASNNTYLAIKNATKKGYAIATNGDSVNLAYPNSTTRRGRVGKEVSQTLQCTDNMGVVEKSKYSEESLKRIKQNIIKGNIANTLTANAMQSFNHNNCALINNDLRIRKLTPKECWRLMGFDDSDFEKAEKVNSNTQLYKQARKLNLCTSFRKDFLSIIFKIKEKNMSKRMLPNDEKLIELYIKQNIIYFDRENKEYKTSWK